ncbi:MAG TPA: hypothetical protein VM890_06555, partial [Longimicrobium sp.]|nr:hypothetical protein [Longimicrobium sp.]
IVTGATAILLAAAFWLAPQRVSPKVVLLWNVLGSLLLANVVTIAILSAPTPLRTFMNEPANTWITQAPFVWLPAVFVVAALAGHVVVFRRLRMEAQAQGISGDAGTRRDAASAPRLRVSA